MIQGVGLADKVLIGRCSVGVVRTNRSYKQYVWIDELHDGGNSNSLSAITLESCASIG
jgi:hypothetical protein